MMVMMMTNGEAMMVVMAMLVVMTLVIAMVMMTMTIWQ